MNTAPRVFVSYSHDSEQHKAWVLNLARRLRNAGVNAVLDQWDLGPGDDVPTFMEKSLVEADRVLLICTETYVEKANAGRGGVGYEKMIVTAELMRRIASNKAIPIVRQFGTTRLPVFIATKMYLDFSREEQFESAFDTLIGALHNAPISSKPPVATRQHDVAGSAPGVQEEAPYTVDGDFALCDSDYAVRRAIIDCNERGHPTWVCLRSPLKDKFDSACAWREGFWLRPSDSELQQKIRGPDGEYFFLARNRNDSYNKGKMFAKGNFFYSDNGNVHAQIFKNIMYALLK